MNHEMKVKIPKTFGKCNTLYTAGNSNKKKPSLMKRRIIRAMIPNLGSLKVRNIPIIIESITKLPLIEINSSKNITLLNEIAYVLKSLLT